MTTTNNTPETDFRKTVAEISAMTEQALDADDSDMLCLLCSKAHELAIEARSLYRNSGDSDSTEWLRAELVAQGYFCERHGNAVWITLPLLLPKRGGDARFITEPLVKLLSMEISHERFLEATIVYIQTYDRRKKVSVMRDADNLEDRVVQNTIERYLLTSDSSYLCSTVHIGKMGDADKTTIVIFPKKLGIFDIKEVLQ